MRNITFQNFYGGYYVPECGQSRAHLGVEVYNVDNPIYINQVRLTSSSGYERFTDPAG